MYGSTTVPSYVPVYRYWQLSPQTPAIELPKISRFRHGRLMQLNSRSSPIIKPYLRQFTPSIHKLPGSCTCIVLYSTDSSCGEQATRRRARSGLQSGSLQYKPERRRPAGGRGRAAGRASCSCTVSRPERICCALSRARLCTRQKVHP